jgi:diacylglycerol O-acyltransferase / wax synthase
MRKLRQLTPQEVLFVGGETSTIYHHTSGLTLLDASERSDFGFDSIRRHLEERLANIPHFRWRLHEVPLGLDLPYWVEDENFSFGHHIRRIGVPSPGDRKALGELVSYLYSRHLDRSRPLWETWFIEGLADGQYALFSKLHHCMMDGQGASKLGEAICDFEPDAPPREIDPAIAEAWPGQTPERWRESLNAALRLSGLPIRASREIYDAVRRDLWQRITQFGKPRKRPRAPTASFNCEIGSERGFVFGSLPLADVKTVKTHFDVTVNDILLALVGSSLRSYLLGRGELPAESLRTSIVVSLRTDDDDQFSNKVTTTSVTLATRLADPVQRLRAIAKESGRAKREARGGAKGFLESVSILPPVLVSAMVSMTPAGQVPRITGMNLVVSNVRGSPMPMYIGGARTSAMYPMSIIAPGGGINVTCISYMGNVDFGVTLEPKVFPDPWRLIGGLQEALAEYVKLTRKRARRR